MSRIVDIFAEYNGKSVQLYDVVHEINIPLYDYIIKGLSSGISRKGVYDKLI